MANEQNLKILSPNEAREYGRAGGIVSGQVRRERKKARDTALAMASVPLRFANTQYKADFLRRYGIENPTLFDTIIASLIDSATRGNLQAIKLFLELTGDAPRSTIPAVPCTMTQQEIKVSYKAKQQEFS